MVEYVVGGKIVKVGNRYKAYSSRYKTQYKYLGSFKEYEDARAAIILVR